MAIEAKLLMGVGLIAATIILAKLVWSIALPERRIWPPKNSTRTNQLWVWFLTLVVFCSAFVLGLLDWDRLNYPTVFRWGIGLPFIAFGNLIVWQCVFQLGLETTSGAVGTLKNDGIYALSRNPQYIADILILLGWAILSASLLTLPIVGAGVIILFIAPFAEESWLKETYGSSFEEYCTRTRRFL